MSTPTVPHIDVDDDRLPLLPARLLNPLDTRGRKRFITVTDGTVKVEVSWYMGQPWRCSACGPMDRADCAHTFAAGVLLADHLLGLTPTPTLPREDHP